MKLTDDDILEFQTMCREHLGLDLEWQEAQDRAIKFVRMMQLVHQPMNVEEFEALKAFDAKQSNHEVDHESNHPEN